VPILVDHSAVNWLSSELDAIIAWRGRPDTIVDLRSLNASEGLGVCSETS
jgi:hypothetical protein